MSTREPDAPESLKGVIDWRAIHRRLDTARAVIERLGTPSVEDTRRILKERAHALAREPITTEAAGQCLDVVEFTVAYERYAVESRYVREVAPMESLTPVPCTPAFVYGIVSLRGEMISVIDIKKFFDLPEQGLSDLNQILVLASQNMRFALLTDAILGVRQLPLSGIVPSLPTLTGIREEYLYGVTRDRVAVLDAEKLLTDEKIVVQEQVAG
ncbi:MAG: chemotaxis protein CheW [Gammaproteobacteria bacterium]